MKQKGFTIVELLIVIVVIGILAAITIVAYSGIQNRGHDAAVKADLSNFAKLMEVQKADLGRYPATLTVAMGFKFSKNAYGLDAQSLNVRYCYNSSTDTYVLVSNSKSGNYFMVLNGVISATTSSNYGWNTGDVVGLYQTNPSQNGLSGTTWDSWTN
jgi:general secretion pathway protein G